MIDDIVEKIYEVIKDYRCEDGYQMTKEHIKEWGLQFGDDAEFVLEEFAHIVHQVYLSKDGAYKFLNALLDFLCSTYKARVLQSVLADTCFMDMQPQGKSQGILLQMLNELVLSKTGQDLSYYADCPKKHYVYLDDVLASGKTVADDLIEWLNVGSNAEDVKNKKIDVKVITICRHDLGYSLQWFRITKNTDNFDAMKLIPAHCCYRIENNATEYESALNIAMPIKTNLSERALQYFNCLNADEKYEKYGFRKEGYPRKESFFSNPENRNRFEQIIVNKGIELIQSTANPGPYVRPLGLVNPKYKTLGMGTHFFTWRNIPNNSPLVYWWEVQGTNWISLFPKK